MAALIGTQFQAISNPPPSQKRDGCKGPQKTWLGAPGSKANFSAPKLPPKKGAPVLNRTVCSKREWVQEPLKCMS